MLSKLSSFESDDWDLAHVRGVVDLSLVLDGIIAKFEHLDTERHKTAKPGREDDMMTKSIPIFKQYRERFERKREALMGGNAAPEQIIDEQLPPQIDGGFGEEVVFGQLDDAFWQEIMEEWGSF